MNENVNQTSEFVFRRLEDPIRLWGNEISGAWWLLALAIVLVLAGSYVVLMYIKDSKSVGVFWSLILGSLRLAVYALLAIAFLLPAKQSYDITHQYPKVLIVFDTSLSMLETKDDLPTETTPPEK